MTKQELENRNSIKEIWALFKDTNKMFKEAARMSKETDKKLELGVKESENLRKTVEALTGKWGRFVEGLIAPAVERLFKEWGIAVDKVFQRVKTPKNGHSMEIDIMAVNGEYVVLIEAKSSLKVEDVKEHIKHIGEFKDFFPEYRDRKVVGVVAGIVIDERSDRYAYTQGLFVIGLSGDSVKIINNKKFQPKIW